MNPRGCSGETCNPWGVLSASPPLDVGWLVVTSRLTFGAGFSVVTMGDASPFSLSTSFPLGRMGDDIDEVDDSC